MCRPQIQKALGLGLNHERDKVLWCLDGCSPLSQIATSFLSIVVCHKI